MKKVIFFAAAFGFSLLSAAPVVPEINGNFADKGKNWYVPGAKFASLRILPSGELELNRKPDTPYADLASSKGFEIKPGDEVSVTFTAQGTGKIEAGVVIEKVGNRTKVVTLKPGFNEYTVVVNLQKDQKKLPQKGYAKFIISNNVNQLTLKNCKVTINQDK